jgi:hypothetical protein
LPGRDSPVSTPSRELSRLVGKTIEIVVINSTDYFLYLPLMPQVAGGLIEPRYIRVSLPRGRAGWWPGTWPPRWVAGRARSTSTMT